jgi:hypothetical protein
VLTLKELIKWRPTGTFVFSHLTTVCTAGTVLIDNSLTEGALSRILNLGSLAGKVFGLFLIYRFLSIFPQVSFLVNSTPLRAEEERCGSTTD